MAEYVCLECGKNVNKILVERRIRCPYCSSKALSKTQSRVSEILLAR